MSPLASVIVVVNDFFDTINQWADLMLPVAHDCGCRVLLWNYPGTPLLLLLGAFAFCS